jgi:hypothetical protein
MVKYKLICFYSEGPPYDNGLPLAHCKEILTNSAKDYFDEIIWYTPTKLRKMGYDYYVKERVSGLVKNAGMHNIGNCAWRPLIMLLELKKMQEGDILVYRDCSNRHKIMVSREQFSQMKQIIDYCLKTCGFDFFVPREQEKKFSLKLQSFVKTNIIRELGENHPFTYKFPLLYSGLLTIARKSPISIQLLTEWKEACEKEEWMDGKIYGPLHSEFKWFTPEQGILCVIISNWIRKRKFNIPLDYPKIQFFGRNITRYIEFNTILPELNGKENYEGEWCNLNVPDDFDWECYVNKYSDLQKDGIDTKEKAETHWLNHGRYEGKKYK